jgi:hypothetical protein
METPQTPPSVHDTDYLKWIDSRFADEVNRLTLQVKNERDYLQNTLVHTLKVGGVLIGVALAILTFVGVTKWEDISSKINDALTKKSETLEAQYKTRFEKLSDSAFVSEMSIEVAADKLNNNPNNRRSFTLDEVKHILAVISDAQTEARTFLAATELISNIRHDPDQTRAIDRSLLNLVKAERAENWLRSDTVRWSQLITVAGRRSTDELKPPLRQLLRDEKLPKEVRLTAMSSLATLNDRDTLNDAISLLNSNDSELATLALVSLITVQPAHPRISSWKDGMLAQASFGGLTRKISALSIIGQAIMMRSLSEAYDNDDEGDVATSSLAADIIVNALDFGVKFEIISGSGRPIPSASADRSEARILAIIPRKGADLDGKIVNYGSNVFLNSDVLRNIFDHGYKDMNVSGFAKYGDLLTNGKHLSRMDHSAQIRLSLHPDSAVGIARGGYGLWKCSFAYYPEFRKRRRGVS